jgi:predicted nucleic acid-binding protein
VLVLDASVALNACSSPAGFDVFKGQEVVGPPLLWSESRSALHEMLYRKEISLAQALRTLDKLERGPIRVRTHRQLGRTAWSLAEGFGWAKTYDAEYLALAQLLHCRLVTIDMRLRRAASRRHGIVTPTEL